MGLLNFYEKIDNFFSEAILSKSSVYKYTVRIFFIFSIIFGKFYQICEKCSSMKKKNCFLLIDSKIIVLSESKGS